MALSRKREKELKRLREAASDLWGDQKDVLENASYIVREASRQAANVGREEVAPRVKDAIDNNVRPALSSGMAATRGAADATREKFNDLLPGVSSALASALAVLEVAKDPRVREVLSRASKASNQLGSKVGIVPAKSNPGPGRYILMSLAVIATVGVAYAAWQTLRADDELWVSDDDEVEEIEPRTK